MNKKISIIILMFILISSISFSKTNLEFQVDKELKAFADTIDENLSIDEKANIVYNYIEQEINHVVYYYSRSYALTWYQREGDCNDKVLLTMIILDYLNITSRPIYGRTKDLQTGWGYYAHAWLEYYNGEEWVNIEEDYWERMFKIRIHKDTQKLFDKYKR